MLPYTTSSCLSHGRASERHRIPVARALKPKITATSLKDKGKMAPQPEECSTVRHQFTGVQTVGHHQIRSVRARPSRLIRLIPHPLNINKGLPAPVIARITSKARPRFVSACEQSHYCEHMEPAYLPSRRLYMGKNSIGACLRS